VLSWCSLGCFSLPYDVLELQRAQLIRVSEYAQNRAYMRADFELSPEGADRLMELVARDIASLALNEIAFKDYVAGVQRVAAWS
jgi:hypothetical protein